MTEQNDEHAPATITRVGASRGWVRLSIDGRDATVPGEVIPLGVGRADFVTYLNSTRWTDDGSRLPADLLAQVRVFLLGRDYLVE
ncbi:hypothetical protein [Actinoplanes awajinensis]|uniref:hypothetical protein n=1 Tax=Actinoplanes awajinensis TaxID=135946 RepID=UPI000B2DFB0B|nr:hypothetical protein [Actinoplanes awajinensis]